MAALNSLVQLLSYTLQFNIFSDQMALISKYQLSLFSAVANCVLMCLLALLIFRSRRSKQSKQSKQPTDDA